MLERLGSWAARQHRWVIIGWLIVVVVIGGFAAAKPGKPVDSFAIPGAQSQEALDLLTTQFPEANGTSAQVVLNVTSGKLTDAANASAIAATVANLNGLPNIPAPADFNGVSTPSVPNPLAKQATGVAFNQGNLERVQNLTLVNPSSTVAYIPVNFTNELGQTAENKAQFEKLKAATAPAAAAGIAVNFGGPLTDAGDPPESWISEHADLLGLLMAVIILVIALGSIASMSVPIIVAVTSVLTSTLIVTILMNYQNIGSVAPILGTMIGLGVGIDYSLFIVSRHRQNLAEGMEIGASVGNAIRTSGSAVLFAGITVCIALSGLYFVGIPYVTTMGVIASLFVVVTIIAALTLVPALLGAYGAKINSLKIHKNDETKDVHKTLSARWAAETSRHPIIFASLSFVFLAALAIPLFSINLGFTDDGEAIKDSTQRIAYDLMTENFGKGINGPLIVAVALPPITKENALSVIESFSNLQTAIKTNPGVAAVSLPLPNNPSIDNLKSKDLAGLPTAAIFAVIPKTAPNDAATTALVNNLRTETIPTALAGAAISKDQVFVGGTTALLIDLTTNIKEKLKYFIGGVILLAMLLLMMVFRSLFVPFKAAVMNLLSIGAALGIVVMVFNWGWGKSAIGLSDSVPIVAFVPVMMFAVLFGLSMDYEVFLLSRIKEIYNETGENRESVVTGLATTARVITSAALIMICVFLAFVTNPDPTVKMIGFGMAVAVFLDATIVRMILVPSSMELAGKANWWIPKWLDKILPHINID